MKKVKVKSRWLFATGELVKMNNLTTLIWNGVKRKTYEVNIFPVILKSALNFDLQELICNEVTRCYKIVHFYRY